MKTTTNAQMETTSYSTEHSINRIDKYRPSYKTISDYQLPQY